MFFFSCYGDHRDLHSFPTRRSSDLRVAAAGDDVDHTRGNPGLLGEARELERRCRSHFRRLDDDGVARGERGRHAHEDRKSTRLNSSHMSISYAVFCLKKKKIVYCETRSPLRSKTLPFSVIIFQTP